METGAAEPRTPVGLTFNFIGDDEMRKQGVLKSWHENGYGMVAVSRELYFLHAKNVSEGNPEVGAVVEFETAPPFGKGKFEQAIKAVVLASGEVRS